MGESLPPPWDFWRKEAKSVREWERVSHSRRFFGRKKLKVHGNGRLNRIYSMRREAEENLSADDVPAVKQRAGAPRSHNQRWAPRWPLQTERRLATKERNISPRQSGTLITMLAYIRKTAIIKYADMVSYPRI